MEYKYEYICQMKQPVLCELCNKSYALGVMKKPMIIHMSTTKEEEEDTLLLALDS
jgi:hypothetical protein